MKKIVSFIFVTLVVTSLSANHTLGIDSKLSKNLLFKELMQCSEANEKIASSNTEYRHVVEPEVVWPVVQSNQYSAKTTQKNANVDTLELRFKNFYNDPIYYEVEINEDGNTTGGDWYIVLRNERYQFIFDYYGGTPEDCTGTFSVKDTDPWAWARIPEANGKSSYYETCDFTVTSEKVSDNLTLYTLEAFVTVKIGWEGDVYAAYKIYAEHKSITPSVEVETAFVDATITPDEGVFTIETANDSIAMTMPLFSDFGIQGYYTDKNIDFENFQLTYNNKSYEPMKMEGIITVADLTTGGMAYVAFIELLTTDTTFFNIVLQAPIKPTDTIEFVCNNLVLDDQYGYTDQTIYFTASDKQYSIVGAYNDTKITAPASYEGTSSSGKAGLQITDRATEKVISYFSAKIDVLPNRKGGYILRVEMLGDDHKFYTAQLSWNVPKPVRTVELKFSTCAKAAYYVDEFGMAELQLANYNEDYSLAFDILYIDQVMGEEFTKANLWMEQTYIVKHTEEYDISIDLAEISGKIMQKNDTTYLNAEVIGFDSVKYVISMFYTVPVPTDVVTYFFDDFAEDEVEFINALPQKIFILEALSGDGQLMATVQVNGIETKTIDGTYYNDGKFTHNDFYTDNTFVEVWNETTEKFERYHVQKGEMKVSVDENNNIIAIASFICENAKQYNLTFKTSYERAHLLYDTEEGAVDYTYNSEAHAYAIDYIDSYGMIYLEILAADSSNISSFYFYSSNIDTLITIPAGIYPINDSGQLGTVIASRGVGVDGYPLQSYFCTFENIDGELYYNELYCMIEGQIIVEKVDGNIKLEVDAINSYDVPIKLHYEGPVRTSIENISISHDSLVEKRIVGGQLQIIRNGIIYDVMGNRIDKTMK